MTSRHAIIVWFCCAVLALLTISGAHGHRFDNDHLAHPDHQASRAASSSFSVDSAVDLHEHLQHGAGDVGSPTKVFAKTPLLKLDLSLLAWASVLLLFLFVNWQRVRLPDLSGVPRSRPPHHLLPPSQAPPRIT